jgi:hypothetical protein
MSLETTGAWAVVYANLAAHREEWGEPTSAFQVDLADFGGFYAATLPARARRLCPNFRKAHVEAMVRSTYKQVPLSISAAKTAPSSGAGVAQSCPCTEPVPCFVRPRRCGEPILGRVAGSCENSAEEGQTVCGRHVAGTWHICRISHRF